MDLALRDAVTAIRPEGQFVRVGPVVKIDPAQHPLSRPEAVRPAASFSLGMGCRTAAIRPQRGGPFHQSDQNAGISGSRLAGGFHPDDRCRSHLRRYRARADRRHADAFVSAFEAALKEAEHPDHWLGFVGKALGEMS
jgi:hypothetical protein